MPPGSVERAIVSKQRVLLGLSIIAAGICASLPFRRERPADPPPSTAVASPPAASPLLEKPSAATIPVLSSASPYLDNGSQRLEPNRFAGAGTSPAVEEIAPLPQDKPVVPPMLPVSFQVKDPTYIGSGPWEPAKMAEGPAGPPREYRLRKLDTLEDLAERFLGSRDKADELFEANRSVLKDRRILPIGAVIRIPAGGTSATAGSAESDLRPVNAEP